MRPRGGETATPPWPGGRSITRAAAAMLCGTQSEVFTTSRCADNGTSARLTADLEAAQGRVEGLLVALREGGGPGASAHRCLSLVFSSPRLPISHLFAAHKTRPSVPPLQHRLFSREITTVRTSSQKGRTGVFQTILNLRRASPYH